MLDNSFVLIDILELYDRMHEFTGTEVIIGTDQSSPVFQLISAIFTLNKLTTSTHCPLVENKVNQKLTLVKILFEFSALEKLYVGLELM